MLVGYYIIKYFYEVIVKKKAFTLFELLLVVILIGLVYSLVLGKMNNKKNLNINKLENLKSILLKYNQSKINLIVFDKCKRVLINHEEKDFDSDLFKDIEVFKVIDGTMQKISFDPLYIKDKVYEVCFRFDIYTNGSSSSYIIKKDDQYIVFYPYFKDYEIFKTQDEAIDALENKKLMDEYEN